MDKSWFPVGISCFTRKIKREKFVLPIGPAKYKGLDYVLKKKIFFFPFITPFLILFFIISRGEMGEKRVWMLHFFYFLNLSMMNPWAQVTRVAQRFREFNLVRRLWDAIWVEFKPTTSALNWTPEQLNHFCHFCLGIYLFNIYNVIFRPGGSDFHPCLQGSQFYYDEIKVSVTWLFLWTKLNKKFVYADEMTSWIIVKNVFSGA